MLSLQQSATSPSHRLSTPPSWLTSLDTDFNLTYVPKRGDTASEGVWNDLWSALALAVVDVDTIATRVGRLDGSLTPLPVPNSGTQMPLVAQFPFISRVLSSLDNEAARVQLAKRAQLPELGSAGDTKIEGGAHAGVDVEAVLVGRIQQLTHLARSTYGESVVEMWTKACAMDEGDAFLHDYGQLLLGSAGFCLPIVKTTNRRSNLTITSTHSTTSSTPLVAISLLCQSVLVLRPSLAASSSVTSSACTRR